VPRCRHNFQPAQSQSGRGVYTPKENSALDTSLQYILYKLVRTDLSFEETRAIIQVLSNMKLNTNPERVSLSMRPAYAVQDIPYDENNLVILTPEKKIKEGSKIG